MKLSFRNRIALFTALAAAATIGLVFVIVYGVVYSTAYNHLDDDLVKEKEEVLHNLRWTQESILINSLPEWEEKEHGQIEVNPTFLQIVDARGDLLFRSSNLQKDILLIDLGRTQTSFFNSRIGDQRIRLGQFVVQNKQGTIIGYLSVGISQEESAIVLHNLRTTLWIAFPLLLIVLFLVTALAASKGIAPVRQLIRSAAGISTSNIHDRLPLPENEDEIRQLATTINELLQRIENGILREKQFTADASHEIRTPLTAIRGTLEVLVRKRRQPEQYEEKIGRVIREADRLDGMLDQLLQLARLESGNTAVRQTPVPLDALLNSLAEKWQPGLEKKNLYLNNNIPPGTIVITDAALLEIVLDNLLGNALKYGRSNGQIECSWEPVLSALSISDDGPGISAEQLPLLFDRFYRTDESRNSTVQGAGLGLSIAKKLADLLKIALSVSSREGHGTVFTLRFSKQIF